MKRVPGYTIPMVPMHLPPMAPMNLVEQIRALAASARLRRARTGVDHGDPRASVRARDGDVGLYCLETVDVHRVGEGPLPARAIGMLRPRSARACGQPHFKFLIIHLPMPCQMLIQCVRQCYVLDRGQAPGSGRRGGPLASCAASRRGARHRRPPRRPPAGRRLDQEPEIHRVGPESGSTLRLSEFS